MSNTAVGQVQIPSLSDDLAEVLAGLREPLKTISPKFFYDDVGSKLFDQICDLPEYYPTRTELKIMLDNMDELADLVGPQASLIEFGSGSSYKTRVLLEKLSELAAYVPVDISGDYLLDIATGLRNDFPHIEVLPIAADFTQPFELPNPKVLPVKNVVYFPGSTIGNFSPDGAHNLLRVMHHEAGENGALLIGVDLQKDVDILLRAYNDAQGVTAAFNLNVLRRLNNEFFATFNVEKFRHRAIYNRDAGRVEMYLDSLADQFVYVDEERFELRKGESILTEHSHKYTLEGFAKIAKRAGFRVERVWVDAARLFSVQYCVRD